jgi:hypothetical protein
VHKWHSPWPRLAGVAGLLGATLAGLASVASARALTGGAWPFASEVHDYSPAPGQFVNNPLFNVPSRALGPPVGGGALVPDNSKLVTLGGFGGSITLRFDRRVPNLPPSPANPLGLDAVVFGNAAFVAGDPARRFAECATIEVALADGPGGTPGTWYLIRGSHHDPPLALTTRTWNATALPPAWVPPGRAGTTWQTSAYALPAASFAPPLVLPLQQRHVYGYADLAPVMVLGDLDGDGVPDDPTLTPAQFYTRPSNPFLVQLHGALAGPGLPPTTGAGGDAFDLDWAIDPVTGLPPSTPLPGFDYIRITTAVDAVHPLLGEVSTEIGGVAAVVPPSPTRPSDIAGTDGTPGADGQVDNGDFTLFIASFFNPPCVQPSPEPCGPADIAGTDATPGPDGRVDNGDFALFISDFFLAGPEGGP